MTNAWSLVYYYWLLVWIILCLPSEREGWRGGSLPAVQLALLFMLPARRWCVKRDLKVSGEVHDCTSAGPPQYMLYAIPF